MRGRDGNRRCTTAAIALVALVALGCLGGCAVLTIDVDVYKGPLANHERVQTEQLAAMAIGAKPMLVALRDRLEWGRNVEEGREEARQGGWYLAKYVEPPARGESHFEDESADRVNDVLSLYEDQQILDGYLSAVIETAKAAYERSRTQWSRFSEISDESWLEELKKQLRLRGPSRAGQQLADGYVESFFGKREGEGYRYSGRIVGQLRINNLVPLSATPTPDTSANAFFQALSDATIVRGHAREILEDGPFRRKFVASVTTLSESFLKSRDALHELLVTVLRGIEHLGASGEEPKLRERLLRLGSRMAAQLIEAPFLAAVLTYADSSREPELYALKKRLEPVLSPTFFTGPGVWDTGDRKHDARRLVPHLEILLLNEPTRTARALLRADELFRSDEFDDPVRVAAADLRIQNMSHVRRRFGISVARNDNAESNRYISETLPREMRELSGLGGGRLPDGLETLIGKYVRVHDNPAGDDTAKRHAKDRLVDALIRFAQKVLFLANNQELLGSADENQNYGMLTGGIKKAWEIGVMDVVSNQDSNQDYTRILQAVGNSILVQADELRHREEQEKRLKDDVGREVEALRASFAKSSSEVIDEMAEFFETEAARLETVIADERARRDRVGDGTSNDTRSLVLTAKNGSGDAHRRAVAIKPIDATDVTNAVGTAKPAVTQSSSTGKNDAIAALAKVESAIGNGVTKLFAATDGAAFAAAAKIVSDEALRIHTKVSSASDDKDRVAAENDAFDSIPGLRDKISKAEERGKEFLGAIDRARQALRDLEGLLAAATTAVKALDPAVDAARMPLEQLSLQSKRGTLDASEKAAREALASLDALDVTLASSHTRLKRRRQARDELDESITRRSTRRTNLQATVEVLESEMAGILAAVNTTTVADARDVVRAALERLNTRLKEEQADDGSQEEAAAIETTVAVVDDYLGSLPSMPIVPDDANDSKDVLDALIAALKYQYLREVSRTGDSSDSSRRLAQALKTAFVYRSDMVYIRPPSAYLRTSFPASSLQNDPALQNTNMLRDHALSSTPFLSDIRDFSGGGRSREDRRIQTEIDKQFWQSINQVRVSGVGNSNYVLAKDDIGNWYLKNYSTNVEKIVESAKNLALFGLSPATGANLLERAGPTTGGGLSSDAAGSLASGAGQNGAGDTVDATDGVFPRFRDRYDSELRKTRRELDADVARIHQSVTERWSGDGVSSDEDFERALDGKAGRLAPPDPPEPGEDPPTAADAIIERLHAVLEYRRAVASAVGAVVAKRRGELDERQDALVAAIADIRAKEQRRDDAQDELVRADEEVAARRQVVERSEKRITEINTALENTAEPEQRGILEEQRGYWVERRDEDTVRQAAAQATRDLAATRLAARESERTNAVTARDTAESEAKTAKKRYDETVARAKVAMTALDAETIALARRYVDRRIQAAESYRTAVGVFGESAGE